MPPVATGLFTGLVCAYPIVFEHIIPSESPADLPEASPDDVWEFHAVLYFILIPVGPCTSRVASRRGVSASYIHDASLPSFPFSNRRAGPRFTPERGSLFDYKHAVVGCDLTHVTEVAVLLLCVEARVWPVFFFPAFGTVGREAAGASQAKDT